MENGCNRGGKYELREINTKVATRRGERERERERGRKREREVC